MAVQIRHGDVLLTPVACPPADAKFVPARGIRIAGERTGHAHVLDGDVAVTPAGQEFVRGGSMLTHEEHGAVKTDEVWYEVRVQREHVPQEAARFRWD